jgi:hypothetical protein
MACQAMWPNGPPFGTPFQHEKTAGGNGSFASWIATIFRGIFTKRLVSLIFFPPGDRNFLRAFPSTPIEPRRNFSCISIL